MAFSNMIRIMKLLLYTGIHIRYYVIYIIYKCIYISTLRYIYIIHVCIIVIDVVWMAGLESTLQGRHRGGERHEEAAGRRGLGLQGALLVLRHQAQEGAGARSYSTSYRSKEYMYRLQESLL